MSAALAASQRGHRVTLVEKDNRLGGQLHLAGAPPGREEFNLLTADLTNQLGLHDIRVRLNTTGDRKLLEDEQPDHVIVATGAESVKPPINGADLPNVVQAWDVLAARVGTGEKVVIIGGGAVGVETALFLAEKGTLSADVLKFLLVNRAEEPETLYELASRGSKQITLVEMIDRIGKDIGKTTRWGMLQELQRLGVETLSNTEALEITPKGVSIWLDDDSVLIEADTVVLAAGSKPFNPFKDLIRQSTIPFDVIGDAGKVATAFEAVHHGYTVGRTV